MELSDYVITEDISEATAWVSELDENSIVKEFIIPNKIYKLYGDLIESEDGYLSTYYMTYKGYFIKPKYN
jgi:hypothetical protein